MTCYLWTPSSSTCSVPQPFPGVPTGLPAVLGPLPLVSGPHQGSVVAFFATSEPVEPPLLLYPLSLPLCTSDLVRSGNKHFPCPFFSMWRPQGRACLHSFLFKNRAFACSLVFKGLASHQGSASIDFGTKPKGTEQETYLTPPSPGYPWEPFLSALNCWPHTRPVLLVPLPLHPFPSGFPSQSSFPVKNGLYLPSSSRGLVFPNRSAHQLTYEMLPWNPLGFNEQWSGQQVPAGPLTMLRQISTSWTWAVRPSSGTLLHCNDWKEARERAVGTPENRN